MITVYITLIITAALGSMLGLWLYNLIVRFKWEMHRRGIERHEKAVEDSLKRHVQNCYDIPEATRLPHTPRPITRPTFTELGKAKVEYLRGNRKV